MTSQYNALNQLQYSAGPGADEATYAYDLAGNRTRRYQAFYGGDDAGGETTYHYDGSNRLVSADFSGGDGGGTEVFRAYYDARSRRIAKTEDYVTTRYRYDGGTNVQEVDQGDHVAKQLVRAGGLGGGIGSVLYSDTRVPPPAGSTAPATTKTEFFAYNAVGSTVALTDSNGIATQRTMYEAFGEVVISDGDSDNNRLRNTKERDKSIGLDNDGMRYYDPATGVYVQRDPIGYGDGLNVYASVHANPLNFVDPLGLSAESVDEKLAQARKDVQDTVNAHARDMVEGGWTPSNAKDDGAFGKALEERVGGDLSGKDGWYTNVRVDMKSKQIISMGVGAPTKGTKDIVQVDAVYSATELAVGSTVDPKSTSVFDLGS